MADDQLAGSLEQVDQGRRAGGALEDVRLVDVDHGETAALRAERVAGAGHLLLLGQQRLAGGQPLVAGGDAGKV